MYYNYHTYRYKYKTKVTKTIPPINLENLFILDYILNLKKYLSLYDHSLTILFHIMCVLDILSYFSRSFNSILS